MRRFLAGAAAGFTVGYAAVRAVQATRALRRPLPVVERRDTARYNRERRALTLAGLARGMAALGTAAFVVADPLERALAPLPRPLRAPVFAVVLSAVTSARDLGADFVEGWLVERRYGTATQTPHDWLADQRKSWAVSSAIGALLVGGLDAVVQRAPRTWPVFALAATPPLLAFATVIAPTFIMPLFNRYEPLTGDLAESIRALAARFGAGDAAILRFDMSRRTTKANAFVTGVLGTERIAIGDTLLRDFADDETLFVVAHELGHYVRRDPWVGIAASTVAAAITLFGSDALLRATTRRRLDGPAQGARWLFYAGVIQLGLGPALNAYSRAIEARADRFALAATGDAAAGVRAFRRLAESNLAELDPPAWWEALFASHPSLGRRIAALNASG